MHFTDSSFKTLSKVLFPKHTKNKQEMLKSKITHQIVPTYSVLCVPNVYCSVQIYLILQMWFSLTCKNRRKEKQDSTSISGRVTPENGLSSNGIAKTDNVLGRQERANSVAIDSGILGGMPLSHRYYINILGLGLIYWDWD